MLLNEETRTLFEKLRQYAPPLALSYTMTITPNTTLQGLQSALYTKLNPFGINS